MADYMLYVGSHAMDDPYRAALVYAAAIAARDAGYQAQVVLLGDGVLLMKDAIARHAKPLDPRPPLDQSISEAARKGVAIHC